MLLQRNEQLQAINKGNICQLITFAFTVERKTRYSTRSSCLLFSFSVSSTPL